MTSRPYSPATQHKLAEMLHALSDTDLLGFIRENLPDRAKPLLAAELKARSLTPQNNPS